VLRTDNGGELCGKQFDQFYKKYSMACQNTTPYTPQQNGFLEIMNRTLMDKERIILSGDGIA
jgi:transposase InsO family protein